jgi:hypothetical protein
MIKLNYSKLFFLLAIFTLLKCEKDDICTSDIEGTPRLIIKFVDYENLTINKEPEGFSIRSISNEKFIQNNSNDSLLISLDPNKEFSQYEFIINSGSENQNIDTVQINYLREDIYINKACGFKSSFIFNSTPFLIISNGDNWIKSYKVLKDTINNEIQAHLAILH